MCSGNEKARKFKFGIRNHKKIRKFKQFLFFQFIKEQKNSLTEKRAALLAEHLRLREVLHNGGAIITGAIQQPAPEIMLPAPKPVFSAPTLSDDDIASVSAGFLLEEEEMAATTESVPMPMERAGNENSKIVDADFLALNGLMPALPMLYPYTSVPMIPTTPSGTPMNIF